MEAAHIPPPDWVFAIRLKPVKPNGPGINSLLGTGHYL